MFESITRGASYDVQRLTLPPRGALPERILPRRSEHWIVVRGRARVTRGAHVFELHENEAVFIPRQLRHRIENAGSVPLEVIQVRVGGDLGEESVLRLENVAAGR